MQKYVWFDQSLLHCIHGQVGGVHVAARSHVEAYNNTPAQPQPSTQNRPSTLPHHPAIPAAACSSAAGYTFYAGKTSIDGNLGEQHTGKSAAQLAAMCLVDPPCKGFTSSGWLKRSIRLPALWANWSSAQPAGPCDGLFVKDGATYESELSTAYSN